MAIKFSLSVNKLINCPGKSNNNNDVTILINVHIRMSSFFDISNNSLSFIAIAFEIKYVAATVKPIAGISVKYSA